MKVIGITGPTGAGKTTALRVLEGLGAEIIDADEVYHELLRESGEMKAALVSAFGDDILDKEGQVDRKALAGKAYPDRLEELSGLTHPFVVAEVCRRVEEAGQAGRPAAAIDAIALIESGLGERCGVVVAVLAPMEVRIRRIMARDGISEEYARRRALNQKGEDFFRAHSDFVLENGVGEGPEDFGKEAAALFQTILERKPTL